MNHTDLSVTMAEREHFEYLHWKKEREQIDLERLARHKNSKGEWRRAWDVEKTENMFDLLTVDAISDGFCGKRGGYGGRKSQNRQFVAEKKGAGKQGLTSNEMIPKTVPAICSKAKGRDRLTGRAQRWDSKERDDASYMMEECFTLESLDCQENVVLTPPVTNAEIHPHSDQTYKEGNIYTAENLESPGQKRSPGNDEETASDYLNRSVGVVQDAGEVFKGKVVTSSETSTEKAALGGSGEGRLLRNKLNILIHEKQMVKEAVGTDIPAEGIEMAEYLSLLKRGRELVSFANQNANLAQLVKEDKAEETCDKDRVCCTKKQVSSKLC
ncbi:hypothetical protein FKM82_016415 [Ascaphus truei]